MSDLRILEVYSVRVNSEGMNQEDISISGKKVELVDGKLLVTVSNKSELLAFLRRYDLNDVSITKVGETVCIMPIELTLNGYIKNMDFLKRMNCVTCAPKHSAVIIKPYDAFRLRVSDLVYENEYEKQLNYLRSWIISTFHCEKLVLENMFDEDLYGDLKILEFYMLDEREGVLEVNKDIFSYRVFNDKLVLRYLVGLLKKGFMNW